MKNLPKIRATIYGMFVAAQPLIIFYGLSTEAETALWIAAVDGVLSALVGGLALANTPRSGDADA